MITREEKMCHVILVVSVLFVLLFMSGCNALGGLPDSTVNAVANAGGGCVKVTGVWGSGIIIIGSADKGVIRNGEVTVAGDCGGITIKDAAAVRGVAPVPGTITTTVIPGTTTTTVTPANP
jgi:hypothetical protein